MSSKLIKQAGHMIELPNDKCIIDLKIYTSGKIQLQAPEVSPQDLCKLLHGIMIDVTFAALAPKVEPKIEIPQGREVINEQTETQSS